MDPTPSRVRFGDVDADLISGEIWRDGQVVRLQEQPRQVLAALLARPGEVVTREHLREQLWKGDTFVDFEHGLNTAIKKVRQTIGDSAESPRFIETLAKRGYRFMAPVSMVEPSPAAPRTDRATLSHAPRVMLVVFLAATIAIAVWLARLPGTGPVAEQQAPAQLAVIPLRVLASNQDSTYLGIGIADAITTRLANVRQITLRPTSAVLPFKNAEGNPAAIAAALGVQHLLLGTIQESEQAYRVRVQLMRADGVASWGRTYDVARADLLTLQDSVAEQVVAALRLELSPPEHERLQTRYTSNPEAYDLYLRGRTLLVNYTEANMRDAIAYFERALALDPEFALARAGVATACAWFSVRYAYDSQALSWGQRAESEARRALQQDANLGDAHLAIAQAAGTLYGGFDFRTVLRESAAALDRDPSLELAHLARMRAFYHFGLFAQAHEEARRARVLNPTPPVELARLEVAVRLFGGEFKAAADQASALLPRTDAPAVRHYLGLARFYLGDAAGARQMLASAVRGDQPDVRSQASLASIEAAGGLRQEARTRANAIERGPYMDHHVAYSLGAAWAQLGDPAASIRWLQQAADTGFPCLPWFARDSLLDPLRAEPAFKELMSRLERQQRDAGT